MRLVDRREWLKTAGLGGGFALLGGLQTFGQTIAYRQLDPGTTIKLSSNENPYGPSPRVREAMQNAFDLGCRYPFKYLNDLIPVIAEKEGVTEDHIVVTGGSTEGLKAAGLVFGLDQGEVIASDPTFQALLRYAKNFGAVLHRIPVLPTMGHDLMGMAGKINKRTRLIFICNPDNPTGTLLPPGSLKDFCLTHDKDAVIFSDEAYYDFITEPDYPSMVDLVKQDRNIIVSRTFSKVYGLAGLRIGYLVAKPELAARLRNAVMANTNVLAITAAQTALKDEDFYKYSILKNAEAKQYIYQVLDDLGLAYVRSHTNFVFFHAGRPIHGLISDMLKEKVLIGRPFPPKLDWARISTGTMEEMEHFGQALRKVMS